jgi:hypothetical protein
MGILVLMQNKLLWKMILLYVWVVVVVEVVAEYLKRLVLSMVGRGLLEAVAVVVEVVVVLLF